jgi:hypothetical protein
MKLFLVYGVLHDAFVFADDRRKAIELVRAEEDQFSDEIGADNRDCITIEGEYDIIP